MTRLVLFDSPVCRASDSRPLLLIRAYDAASTALSFGLALLAFCRGAAAPAQGPDLAYLVPSHIGFLRRTTSISDSLFAPRAENKFHVRWHARGKSGWATETGRTLTVNAHRERIYASAQDDQHDAEKTGEKLELAAEASLECSTLCVSSESSSKYSILDICQTVPHALRLESAISSPTDSYPLLP